MKNSILVIPTPSNCSECQLMVDRFCYGIPEDEVHDSININERPSWCPLKPLSKGKGDYIRGYNDCMKDMKGETERCTQ